MLGREVEVAVVAEALDRVRAGIGGVLTISGAAGLGKTRLARETVNHANVAMIVARSEPYGISSAYRPMRDPVRRLLGIERGSGPAMTKELLDAVERVAPDLRPFAPLLGDVAHVDVASTPEVEAIASRHRPDRTADVLLEVIARVHTGPLIIGAEDAQWADEATAHLFERIAAATVERPWLVVVLRRDDEGGFRPAEGQRVELAPLEDSVVRDLAITATEATPLRPHEIARIVDQAAGSPQFVEEWAQAAQMVGSIDAVPDSINAVVRAQVDALSPLARRVLGDAAVLGRSFRREVLDAVLAAEDRELDDPTQEELDRLLEPDGDTRLRFRNGLVRDVVYESLPYRNRARIHQIAGETIERGSTDVALDAEVLAEHFWRAGDVERTWRYSLLAADRARTVYANADAAMHLARGLDVAARLALADDEVLTRTIQLGDVRERAGLFADALDAYERATERLPSGPVARADLLLRRARVHERAGAYPTALRTSTRARTLVDGSEIPQASTLRADALAFSALVRQRQEHAALAWQVAEQAMEAGIVAGSRSAQARASNVMSWAAMMLGRPEAVELAERSLELYEEIGDDDGQADLANNLGIMAYFDGRWDETLQRYEQSRRACERVGNLLDAAATEANIGEVLVNQFRLDEAVPLLQDASRVLRSSGHRWGAAFAEMHLGRAALAAGDPERAVSILQAVRDEFAAMGRVASAYEASLHLADAMTAAGRPGDAIALVTSATAPADEVAIFDAALARVLAGALAGAGRDDAAARRARTGHRHRPPARAGLRARPAAGDGGRPSRDGRHRQRRAGRRRVRPTPRRARSRAGAGGRLSDQVSATWGRRPRRRSASAARCRPAAGRSCRSSGTTACWRGGCRQPPELVPHHCTGDPRRGRVGRVEVDLPLVDREAGRLGCPHDGHLGVHGLDRPAAADQRLVEEHTVLGDLERVGDELALRCRRGCRSARSSRSPPAPSPDRSSGRRRRCSPASAAVELAGVLLLRRQREDGGRRPERLADRADQVGHRQVRRRRSRRRRRRGSPRRLGRPRSASSTRSRPPS